MGGLSFMGHGELRLLVIKIGRENCARMYEILSTPGASVFHFILHVGRRF